MNNSLRKYYKLLIAILSLAVFLFYYLNVFSYDFSKSINKFQKAFSQLEVERDIFLKENVSSLQKEEEKSIWRKTIKHPEQNLHIYKNDSLVYWSTNQLPILRFSDIHFPSEGIIHLQNGWYYAKISKEKDYTLCASFLIKKDYSYKNKELKNEFVESLTLPFSTYITFEQENGYPIYSKEKQYLFSINPNDYQTANATESIVLMLLLLFAIVFWLVYWTDLWERIFKRRKWIFPLLIVTIRLISIKFVWFGFMHVTDAFKPNLYGTNLWFPNFFEYLLNVIIIFYLVYLFVRKIKSIESFKLDKIIAFIVLLLSFVFWNIICLLNESLVENSSINLAIEKLFSLNTYSAIAIASIGLLFYSFFLLIKATVVWLKRLNVSSKTTLFISVLFQGLYLFFQSISGDYSLLNDLTPLCLIIIISILPQVDKPNSNKFYFGLIILFFFSLVQSVNLVHYNKEKEKGERILYANQLATEKDVLTEVEYSTLSPKLKADYFLNRMINNPRRMGLSDFEDALENRIFNGYWERYEMSFNLFDTNHFSVISPSINKGNPYQELTQIIESHGARSEIDSNIFFIKDYTGHYSYIIKQPLWNQDSVKMELICTLKSKKIPEEIGFPRILISTKAKVFEPLQNYSIAKYFHTHLVTKYGVFNYPTSYVALNNWKEVKTGFYDKDGYNHYILKKSEDDIVVLSTKNFNTIELITSFSYLFSYFGLLLLIPFVLNRKNIKKLPNGFSLALKIQLVLISLVFLSLFAFGWGSGLFVNSQYNDYTDDLVREKLNSVKIEMGDKLGKNKKLTIEEHGNYIELLLQKFAKVFVTDINLYDKDGFILGASRPKVFNVGLLSEQMNSSAFYQMDIRDKSEFIHQESIGELNYSSAYAPFYNDKGRLLGYLNLQHFGQQKEFENKIQQFLVAIINVFMLLLAVSIVVAIVVSNWVTSPLRILQDSFSKLKFGKHNQPIEYTKEDEIGALVKNYNKKLEELEFTAQQLAQSERESAWREMAKQVAHEIKNPLTPMKLSVQHLLRVYDPSDPKSNEKLAKVSTSIIEQIDALAKIANEFSSFAKLPRPKEKKMDLLPVLKGVIEVFKEEGNFSLTFSSEVEKLFVLADKDLMLRVFNNLLKNAIQAIIDKDDAAIHIQVKLIDSNYCIEFMDNGSGIKEEVQPKIFVPYFTTKGTGTGLGLAMVKQIIENHRGSITFTSSEDGTTFFITLPKI